MNRRGSIFSIVVALALGGAIGCGSATLPVRAAEPSFDLARELPDDSEAVPERAADDAIETTAPATPLADSYRDVADRIIAAALADKGGWDKLEYLTDRIGARLSGSKNLQRAIKWSAETMKTDGHTVRTEKVMVPHWVRGAESAEILSPEPYKLHLIGLGGTVGTPRKGITAEVVVASDFDELEKLGDKVKGKIVLFNHPMPKYHPDKGAGYGKTVEYRTDGPSRAAKLGARAVLVRSVTAHSLQSPHTGALGYQDNVPKIPAAAISVEDAERIARLTARGNTVKVRLKLGAKKLKDAESANVIGELKGSDKPDEIVLLGAHIDSWDVGQGAHDDGTGVVIMMQALTTLRKLGLRPKRTIRVVLFTNEENGLRGAIAYGKAHADQAANHVMSIESDSGGFAPLGFTVQDDETALSNTRDIVTLLSSIGATNARAGFSGADLIPLQRAGAPTLGLSVEGSKYFDYHHSDADTLDKVDPMDLARNIAAVAVLAYIAADMPERFGGPFTPPKKTTEPAK